MKIEQLYQFIVPLMFLAIWALTSLFSRESQPLPPRTSRPPGPNPNGPRQGAGDGRQPLQDWRAETFARETSPSPRPTPDPSPSRRTPRPQLNPSDGIVILEPEPQERRPQAPPLRQQGVTRRPVMKNPKSSLPPGSVEPRAPQRTLGGSLASSMAMSSTMEPSLALTKLSLGVHDAPLTGTTNSLTTASAAAVSRPVDRAGPTAQHFQTLLRSPERLQEALILKELLGPPLALRGRVHRRSSRIF